MLFVPHTLNLIDPYPLILKRPRLPQPADIEMDSWKIQQPEPSKKPLPVASNQSANPDQPIDRQWEYPAKVLVSRFGNEVNFTIVWAWISPENRGKFIRFFQDGRWSKSMPAKLYNTIEKLNARSQDPGFWSPGRPPVMNYQTVVFDDVTNKVKSIV